MFGRNNIQTNFNKYSNPPPNQPYNTPKNYLNYVSFQPNTNIMQRDPGGQPDHVAMYALNVHQHPQIQSPQGQFNSPINRNPYLNAPLDSKRQPPKQTLSRNSSNKEQIASRQSQQLNRSKTQSLKNSSKSNSQTQNRLTSEMNEKGNKIPIAKNPQNGLDNGSPAWSQTVDLGQLSKYRSIQNSVRTSPEEDQLKQKMNYLEVIEQAISKFQLTRAPSDLQQLNQDNKLLMVRAYEEIKKLKQEKKRRSTNDSVSQSDNMSEDGFSLDGREDSRNNSLRLQNEKKSLIEGFSRSKEKVKVQEVQLQKEMRINEKLKQQYEQQLARSRRNGSSQLDTLNQAIAIQQRQIAKYVNLNTQISSKLNKLPFFQEWKIMCEQLEGAKKTSLKLKAELKARNQKLKAIQLGPIKTNSKASENTFIQQEDQKNRDNSLSRNKMPQMATLKIPPSPINRPQGNIAQSTSNRVDSTINYLGDNRPKSVNRNSNN